MTHTIHKESPPCPCCNGESFSSLCDLGQLPLSGHYLDTKDASVETAALALEFCDSCAFVRKVKFLRSARRYDAIDRSTSGQLPFYTPKITNEISQGQNPDDFLLEIGSNDGTFIEVLHRGGFSNTAGVEPSLSLANLSKGRGHRIFHGYFDSDMAAAIVAETGKARTVICRHTLEHIPDPHPFLRAVHSILAPGGRVYIELPNTLWILEKLQIHEIWDEHENYYTPRTLRLCMRSAGFGNIVVREQRHRDASNITCWASVAEEDSGESLSPDLEMALCRSFPQKLATIQMRMRLLSEQWTHPAYVIGGAHNQANFVLYNGIGDAVEAFVDDSEFKQGHFLSAPRPLPVITTENLLAKAGPVTLLATAFPFPDWMDRIRKAREGCGDNWVEPYPEEFSRPPVVSGGVLQQE